MSSVPSWATVDPESMGGDKPHVVQNLLAGTWIGTADYTSVIDPMNGAPMLSVPSTARPEELAAFVRSSKTCPKTGLHNPFRAVERYVMLGKVSARAAAALRDPTVNDFFTRLIQRTAPKSYAQAAGEVNVTAAFLENFSGDNVRFLARSFGVAGDRDGQVSVGHRVPFGPVAIIAPFNFPIEIGALQLMGALYMGNRPTLKTDVDMINSDGKTMHSFLRKAQPRNTLFTGSSRVAEILARDLHGRIRIEDAGFDWKVLGPDVPRANGGVGVDYAAWVCDQDAYACSGQKCSAQSMLIAHKNWVKEGLYAKLEALAARRKLSDLTAGPVMTWTTEAMLKHVAALAAIPGARVLFGGKELEGGAHSIPKEYGAIEPTAVFVPLAKLRSRQYYDLATTEVFGPVQVVTEFGNGAAQLHAVADVLERMQAHLTAAIVSNDPSFTSTLLGLTVNGTTYHGLRARTTGAPQNHWFGPAGDPRGAGIGTREAIQHVWSCHREVIADTAPVAAGWVAPPPT